MSFDVENSKFNTKFKNPLRDLYIYQYKKIYSDYYAVGKDKRIGKTTINSDLKRIRDFAEQCGLKWEVSKNKPTSKDAVHFISADSRNFVENPFHSIYRNCHFKEEHMVFLLIALITLDDRIFLNTPKEKLDEIEKLVADTKSYLLSYADTLSDIDIKNVYVEIEKYCDENNINWDIEDIKNTLFLNKKTIDKDTFSVISRTADNIIGNHICTVCKYLANMEISNYSDYKRLIIDTGICYETGQKNNNFLSISNCYIRDILTENDLCERFCEMIKYCSETKPLGVIGKYLLTRLNYNNANNTIRFCHNYLLKDINDYNIIDLLYAIKNNIWIKINFRNSTASKMQELFCFPLQIRESNTNGRQHLVYYLPKNNSIFSIRIDFIDEILFYTPKKGYTVSEKIQKDIEKSREILNSVWGVSYSKDFNGADPFTAKTDSLKLKLAYNSATEMFIVERLKKEKRTGKITEISADTITYEVDIFDYREMIPWLKSFAGRILSIECSGDNFLQNTIISDIKKALKNYEDEPEYINKKDFVSDKDYNGYGTYLMENFQYKNDKYSYVPHMIIFNMLFSNQFQTYGKELFEFIRGKEKGKTYSPFDWCIDENNTPILKVKDNIDTIYDLIPLTNIEEEWIKNVLSTPHARLFLSNEEITQLHTKFSHRGYFNFSDIYIYDSNKNFEITEHIINNFQTLNNAIKNLKKVDILQYDKCYKDFLPLYLQHSFRDNIIRLYGIDSNGENKIFNLDRIDVALGKNAFIKKDFSSGAEYNEMIIKFTNFKNTHDRMINEFSFWKKECSLDTLTGIYTMKLYYPVEETSELVIRLLGYGSSIYIESDTGKAKEIMISRIKKQQNL